MGVDQKIHTCKNCGATKTETIKKLSSSSENASFRRLAGNDRYGTAYSVAQGYKGDKKLSKLNAVIVACGTNFPDALSANYLSAKYNAPIILTSSKGENDVVSWIKKNVKGKSTVYFVGGSKVVSNSLEKKLQRAGFKVKREAGSDRYGTNLEVLKNVGVTAGSEILVCSGSTFENALIASATGKPMLIVSPGGLSKAQIKYLSSGAIKGRNVKFTVIGDTKSVPNKIFNALTKYGSVKRISASNPDAMSVEVAKRYWPNGHKQAFLATSKNFPDALTGGAVCIANKAPIFLISEKSYGVTSKYLKSKKLNRVTALGGKLVVPDSLVKLVANVK